MEFELLESTLIDFLPESESESLFRNRCNPSGREREEKREREREREKGRGRKREREREENTGCPGYVLDKSPQYVHVICLLLQEVYLNCSQRVILPKQSKVTSLL